MPTAYIHSFSAVVSPFGILSHFENESYVVVTVAGVFRAAGAVGDEEEALGDFQGAVNSSDGGELILVLHSCLLKTLNRCTFNL